MSDMPKEIWAGIENVYLGHGDFREEYYWHTSDRDGLTPYTLTSHHTAEIAKRDRAIEKMQKTLIHLATCSDPFVVDKAERALEEALEALRGMQEETITRGSGDVYKDIGIEKL